MPELSNRVFSPDSRVNKERAGFKEGYVIPFDLEDHFDFIANVLRDTIDAVFSQFDLYKFFGEF